MAKGRQKNLDVVHSGMVMLSDGKGRGKPARLILTKDQLTIQVHVSSIQEDTTSVGGGLVQSIEPTLDMKLRNVNVPRGKEGFGLSIKGGSDGVSSVPIVISKVIENLPAAQTGQIFVGDTIVEINGLSVDGKTHEEVVNMLKEVPAPHVTLTLKHDSQMAPLLRPSSSKQSVFDSIVDINVFKSALKMPLTMDRHQPSAIHEEEFGDPKVWRTINCLPLPMAIVSRYLWGSDKLRNNAFEMRTVDGRSSSIIHCGDRKAMEQWIEYIESHIVALNKKSIRMSNKYLHPSEKISHIGWVEEQMPDGYFEDPKVKWEQRFMIFKGADMCIFASPPLNSKELDKCICLYKIYETAMKTAIKRRDRREFVLCIDTAQGNQHYLSLQSQNQLQQFEAAYYSCVYKAITTLQTRTFACSHEGRPAGMVVDIRQGISLYDIPTKSYLWQYRFADLETSSDDGKMRLQLNFQSRNSVTGRDVMDCKEIECDQIQTVVFILHSFYMTKIMGADPEFLKSTPLS